MRNRTEEGAIQDRVDSSQQDAGSRAGDNVPDDGPTVLVVEDELLIGMDLVMLLEDWGYNAEGPVKSSQEALAKVATCVPDFAVLDVNLGDDDTSFPVAEDLSSREIPFVFLTGYDPARYADEPTMQAAPHLRKPLAEEKLRHLLTEKIPASKAAPQE